MKDTLFCSYKNSDFVMVLKKEKVNDASIVEARCYLI
tara:strand:- start:83 stop:193 length:111 start_codon:yes stop_codon:yes gene_type:complete